MTEEKTKKKREWVKNAAIIFLAVMLVLTFFSNTIMNRSLPEVAAQYVESGSISATVRGSGIVEANEKFSVTTDQSRKVLSVPVKEGDKVAVGDTLILFAEGDGEELKNAQTALDDALYSYKVALLDVGDGSYSKEQRAIEKAQTALDKAKTDRDSNVVSDASIAAAQTKVTLAKVDVAKQEAVVKQLQPSAGSGTDNSAEIAEKKAERTTLTTQRDAAAVTYKNDLAAFDACALAYMKENVPTTTATKATDVYKQALSKQIDRWSAEKVFTSAVPGWWSKVEWGTTTHPTITDNFTAAESFVEGMNEAYKTISSLNSSIANLTTKINSLVATNNPGASASLAAAESKLADLEAAQQTAETALKTLTDKRAAYDAAVEAIYDAQDAYEAKLDDLAKAKLADQKQSLDIQKLKNAVSEATTALNKLKGGGKESSIVSTVNGVVSSITVSAGAQAEPNAELLLVEVPDLGYSVKVSVPKASAQKVRVGDSGTLTGYGYWGQSVEARLTSIRTDPSSPSKNKLLVFDLIGEVDSGSSVSVSIGEKSATYEAIVPNSAIREDTNGKFVLAVMTKSTPISNRYIATRIDVEVVASDDVNSAVTGGLAMGDFVITTSTKPIVAGTQVRLADNS